MSKRKIVVIVLALLLVVTAGTGYAFRGQIRAVIDTISGVDFEGRGVGNVDLKIDAGDSGEVVASKLVELGITKDFSFTYKRIIARNPVFIPGTFTLRKGMSADAALDLLADPKTRVVQVVTIREGLRLPQVLSELSKATKLPLADFESAAKDPTVFGLSPKLTNLDGYLFPATYEINKEDTALDLIRSMVERMNVELDKFGVKVSDRHKVLTLASIVQREARATEDFYKVARVFQNRLDVGMPLQSCATISYLTSGSTFTNTPEERASKNPYNTYLYPGLPVGPIGAPGTTAIDAALHPVEGPWFYFVSVNLETGETEFNETYEGHLKSVKRWDDWLRANPSWIE
jgi:UPF0755 protein